RSSAGSWIPAIVPAWRSRRKRTDQVSCEASNSSTPDRRQRSARARMPAAEGMREVAMVGLYLAHALDILPGSGVHANRFIHVDEKGHLHHGSGFHGGGLGGARGGIALDAGLGIGNFE